MPSSAFYPTSTAILVQVLLGSARRSYAEGVVTPLDLDYLLSYFVVFVPRNF